MSQTALAKIDDGKLYESLALRGDLSGLTPQDKARYYASLCERLGLDPLTQPFTPLKMNGKEILYASRGCTDQLARKHHVDRRIIKEEEIRGAYIVTVEAMLPDGRREQSKGAVPIENLKGEAFCNAIMKAETKAKRRATLSILGLGLLDETELETIPTYRREEAEVVEMPADNGNGKKTADLITEFWTRGRKAGIKDADLQESVSRVMAGEITWTEAIESLPFDDGTLRIKKSSGAEEA